MSEIMIKTRQQNWTIKIIKQKQLYAENEQFGSDHQEHFIIWLKSPGELQYSRSTMS